MDPNPSQENVLDEIGRAFQRFQNLLGPNCVTECHVDLGQRRRNEFLVSFPASECVACGNGFRNPQPIPCFQKVSTARLLSRQPSYSCRHAPATICSLRPSIFQKRNYFFT
jgi:hypothetical protein